ncbi:Stage 0 sporulation protein KA [Anaerohalosphaera lusitana]|uniref:Stage 0 sporulation protein KA n=1 Tax=Anaerohalosphaera lusitana TaxID=1936003 RepID=A0A1U9NPE2_9BACT|nr:ABC transporter substrate-binding protein [Anaerohalosphaera lusitana]AQT69376.1 Stage 0 sporulation protein KA [Anaerohalosphaera lusitana]
MNKIMKTLMLTLLIAIVLGSSGCGKSGPGDNDEGNVTLKSVLPNKIEGVDPGATSDTYSSKVHSHCYETLYTYHYLKRPYEVVPLVADGMPEISDDGTTYTIKIKKGVLYSDDPCFENGKARELVANDFIFAWKRLANIKFRSKNWWIFDDKIVGLDDFREYTKDAEEVDYSRPVEGLQAPDDHTLVIRLTKKWPQILYILAHQPSAPMPPEAVAYYGDDDLMKHTVGTGPFKLNTWHPGSYVEVVRNENYRHATYPTEGEPQDVEAGLLEDAGKQIPFVNRIMWLIIPEDQPRWLQFQQGDVDALGIPKDNFGSAVSADMTLTDEMAERNIDLVTFKDPSTFWLGFNMEDPILGKNMPLRKAISYSINRAKEVEIFWNGRYDMASGFIPPLMKAYNPDIKELGQRYDPDKARELLKEAREIQGGEIPELEISMPGTDTMNRNRGVFLKRCLENIGLKVDVEYTDWPIYLQKISTKSAQLFSSGWIADYPDAENFLQLFYSKNAAPGPNNFNYSSEEFDRIYKKAVAMPDSPERTELYRQAELIVLEDCPAAFITHRVNYMVMHGWLENYKPNVFYNGTGKFRKVDTAERAAY